MILIAQKFKDCHDDRVESHGSAPFRFLKDIQTNVTARFPHIRMEDLSLEVRIWVFKWIFSWKFNLQFELASCIWRVFWANDKTIESELIS